MTSSSGQYYRFLAMFVVEEHNVIYREVGYAALLENLPFIRRNDSIIDSVIWRFNEVGECTMISIVLSRFYL